MINSQTNNSGYNLIGDIHGSHTRLIALLTKLGYQIIDGSYRHPERKTIFLGDFIDRGDENFLTLKTIKTMVDTGNALAVMGNHEYNAICYHTRGKDGNYLRPHNKKNNSQHAKTLAEIHRGNKKLWAEYIEWFRSLPLYLDLEGLRVVHACWHQPSAQLFAKSPARDTQGRLTHKFLKQSVLPWTKIFKMIEILLKGPELALPLSSRGYIDKDGNWRRKVRLKWWLYPDQMTGIDTYGGISQARENVLPRLEAIIIPHRKRSKIEKFSYQADKPVFFGHYWFQGLPQRQSPVAACLDYSVALKGKLVCYCWDGERTINNKKFVWV